MRANAAVRRQGWRGMVTAYKVRSAAGNATGEAGCASVCVGGKAARAVRAVGAR